MTKVRLIIQSHLNDALIEMESHPAMAQERLRFVKYLVIWFSDTNEEIDVETVYHRFKLGEITAKPLNISLEN